MPATPQSAKPPRAPGTDLEASNESSIPEAGINEIAATALSWENPLLSGILSIAGLLVAIAGDYLLRGKHGIPLLSGTVNLQLDSLTADPDKKQECD